MAEAQKQARLESIDALTKEIDSLNALDDNALLARYVPGLSPEGEKRITDARFANAPAGDYAPTLPAADRAFGH